MGSTENSMIYRRIINLLKPVVWRLAEAFDIQVNKPPEASGQNALIIAGSTNQIPRSVYFNTRSGFISIGENTVFGEGVQVLTGKHYNIYEATTLNKPLHYVPESGRDIVIGKNCYIGGGAIIIGPVNIADYAVIGAGSVVTNDIPAKSFAAGVPAKIKHRFDL